MRSRKKVVQKRAWQGRQTDGTGGVLMYVEDDMRLADAVRRSFSTTGNPRSIDHLSQDCLSVRSHCSVLRDHSS